MKRVYLDNAATTQLDPEVLEAMTPYLTDTFGNPSSSHSHGREAKGAVETSRKKICEILNCQPSEIIFTSGGTEADNTFIRGAVETHGIKNIVSCPTEHHAVLHTIEYLEARGGVKAIWLDVDDKGCISLPQLEKILSTTQEVLVSIMHANNEIGTLCPLIEIGELCKQYNAILHSDTVQSIGHYRHDLETQYIHGMAATGHKFHGPKGAGFMYRRKSSRVNPLIIGGPQERQMRGGTENVPGIVGLCKAMEIAYEHLDEHQTSIQNLKSHMVEQLRKTIPGISFNGDLNNSLYTVLNVCLPRAEGTDMLLFQLDLNGVSASSGSACSSGADTGSHVLRAIQADMGRAAVRFSFSKFNTHDDVDYAVSQVASLYEVKVD